MDGESTGIAVLESAPDGSLHYARVVAEVPSPSYLARHGDLLYAAIEGEARVQVYRRGPGTTLEARLVLMSPATELEVDAILMRREAVRFASRGSVVVRGRSAMVLRRSALDSVRTAFISSSEPGSV